MYIHVTVELRQGVFSEFTKTMQRIVEINQGFGWELREALLQVDGRLNTVLHIWKLKDMNHYLEGAAHLQAHPDFAELSSQLGRCVAQEHVVFALPTAYSPSA